MPFEDLDVWKRSCRLSSTLFQELDSLNNWSFRDQVTRAGLSIPSNIAEGCERDSGAEVARFMTIAKGSCGELITQIYIGIEAGFIDKQLGMTWVREAKEINAMLGALIKRHRSRSA